MNIFASLIGLALKNAGGDKTWRVELPRQFPESFVIGILNTINNEPKKIEDGSPEAIGYIEGPDIEVPRKDLVSSEFELVNYRCDSAGERRFLVLRGNAKVESLINASVPIISPSFPLNLGQNLKLGDISDSLSEMFMKKNIEIQKQGDVLAAVEYCLELTAQILEQSAANLTTAWNLEWAYHADRSLKRLIEHAENKAGSSISEENVFYCFGLPRVETTQSPGKLTGQLLTAYAKWWSNLEEINKSSEFIARRIDLISNPNRLLAQVDSKVYTRLYSSRGDSVLTLLETIAESSWVKGLSVSIPIEDFLSPRSNANTKSITSIRSMDDESLSATSKSSDSSPFLVGIKKDGAVIESDQFSIRIKYLSDRVSGKNIDDSCLDMDISLQGFEWICESVSAEVDELVVFGRIQLEAEAAARLEEKMAIEVKISYELVPDSSFTDQIPYSGSGTLILAREWGEPYLITFDARRSKLKLTTTSFGASEAYQSVDSDIQTLGLVVFGDEAFLEKEPMTGLSGDKFFGEKIAIAEVSEVETGGKVIRLFRESVDKSVQSPLVAAIFKEKLAVSEPTYENRNSLWGRLESLVSEKLGDDNFVSNHFHVALAEDVPFRGNQELQTDFPPGFIAQTQVGSFLNNADIVPKTEFLDSSAYQKFTDSFYELDVLGRIEGHFDHQSEWVSKTSWRHLFNEKDKLEGYLDAYNELLNYAKDNFGAVEIFLASYPFSFSSWDLGTGDCTSVLLSPLHPLRLAWLASVESGLWISNDSSNLSGTVEGWNMPFVGPGYQFGSSLLSVPTDYGSDSLFLGWSMMVPIQSQPHQVSVPTEIAASVAPGSSSTGLNSSAVSSALQDFKRVNPHFPALVLDLGASTTAPSSRLTEVDQAVLEKIRSWEKDSDTPPGGVHVLDSNSRNGSPPIAQIQAFAREVNTPFSWQRYEQRAAQSPECQVRFLQDPGVSVQIVHDRATAKGSIPAIPFKRFFSSEKLANAPKGTSSISVHLSSDCGWGAFTEPLSNLESLANGNYVNSSLSKSPLADGSAEWTVSGEGLLNPSSVSTFLSASSRKQQMLWEWHPPYLDRQIRRGQINQRAYMTIARIPKTFRSQLASSLSSLEIEGALAQELADDILRVLGSRGMGLSSLLYMGSTLVKGALGFYSAFKLVDALPMSGNFLTVPIDACDHFLRSLADVHDNADGFRRADLLGILIEDESIRLMPIEIKMYDLDANGDVPLPDPTSAKLDEARDQVAASSKIIDAILAKYESFEGESETSNLLWRTNLASLLETALKLSPNKDEIQHIVARSIIQLLDREISLLSSRPIVMYFSGGSPKYSSATSIMVDNVKHKSGSMESLNIVASATSILKDELSSEVSNRIVRKLLENKNALVPETMDQVEIFDPDVATEYVEGTVEELETELNGTQDKPAPEPDLSFQGYRIRVGTDENGMSKFFEPSLRTNLPHFGVIGNSGSGKTQLMKMLLTSFAQQQQFGGKPGVLIVDYKGDLSEGNDGFAKDNGFEVLSAKGLELDFWRLSAYEIDQLGGVKDAIAAKANSFASFLKKLFKDFGPKQRSDLVGSIKLAYQRAHEAQEGTPLMEDIVAKYLDKIQKADGVYSYLEMMLEIRLFPESKDTAKPLQEIFANDKRIIINFKPLAAYGDDFLKRVSVSVVLEALVQNMYSSYSSNGEYYKVGEATMQRLNQLVFVDEAHNLLSFDLNSLSKIIKEGRSFGHGLFLATQGMDEFDSTEFDYRTLVTNWCIFQMNNPSKANIQKVGIGAEDSAHLRDKINYFKPGEAVFVSSEIGEKDSASKTHSVIKASAYYQKDNQA